MHNHSYSQKGLLQAEKPIQIILPGPGPAMTADQRAAAYLHDLIEREIHEFEVELGAPVRIGAIKSTDGPRFLIGPAHMNPAFADAGIQGSEEPTVWLERSQRLLVADAPELTSISESLSLLRTLTASGASRVRASHCFDLTECIQRIKQEVTWTYPAFEQRRIDWASVCEEQERTVRNARDLFPALQRWIAELGDMHTWVQHDPPHGLLPYTVKVEPERALFIHVPGGTPAAQAGVKPGDELLDVDTTDAIARSGAPVHMQPYLAGRRWLAGPVGENRQLRVRRADNTVQEFSDTPSYQPFPEPSTWTKLRSGTGYLRLRGFAPALNDVIDTAFHELRSCPALIVDLRGNAGGMLTEALSFRDRFIDRPMTMGTIQYSSPAGGLSDLFPIHAEPAISHKQWGKPVRFLIDQMSASACEDALLGLQGLHHVKLVGAQTAGGSGRPRSIRLLAGMRLSVSTALTFDRNGRCIEDNGILPDIDAPVMLDGPESAAIEIADHSW